MKTTSRNTTLRSPDHILLRQVLIDTRKKSGLSQAQVAAALNLPQSYVSKIETGERRLDVVEFVNLCKALDANPSDVIRKLA